MNLSNLKPEEGSIHNPKKRLGRGQGSGKGGTSARGHKGAKSRSGYSKKLGFEGGQMPLQMRLPKFGFRSRVGRFTAEIRTSELNKVESEVVDLEALVSAKLVAANIKRVKVMLSGEVTKALTIEGIAVTSGAKAAIESAGGKVVEPKPAPVKGKLSKKKVKD